MKKIFSTAILLATTSFFAQEGKVGIGNTDPKATLDVTGNASTTTAADGIIAPRLTGNQLAAKDAVYLVGQTGAQVYITAAATTPAGKTINVNAPGYYYFDGTVWQKISNGAGSGKFVDGTTVTDAVYTGGNVGIGTTTPTSELQIVDPNNITLSLDAQGGVYSGVRSDLPNAKFFTGVQNDASNPRFSIYDNINNAERISVLTSNGNVGIGALTPTKKLEVNGDFKNSSFETVNSPAYHLLDFAQASNGSASDWQLYVNGVGSIKDGGLNFYDGSTSVMLLDGANDRVGIGTVNPTKKLEVNGDFKNSSFETVNTNLYQLLDFAQASNGSASDWQLYVNGVGSIKDGGLNFYDGSTSVMLLDGANDRVGIGTTDPTKKLDVNGELRIRTVPDSVGNQSILTVDANGNVSKTNAANASLLANTTGSVATTNVDRTFTAPGTDNNIDLGLTQTITIPANTTAKVFINYSVPAGISSFTNATGYYGVRFLKDGTEQDAGSRKYSFFSGQGTNMTTITNTYFEEIPASASIQTITYSLKGYVELYDLLGQTSQTFRFNMWQPTGNNFNWGKATITVQVYY